MIGAYPPGLGRRQLKPVARTWWAYAICASHLAVHAFDAAGFAAIVFSLVVVPALIVVSIVELCRLPGRWMASRWLGFLPILACVAALFGPWHRFFMAC